MSNPIVLHSIVAQHAEQAAGLWAQRDMLSLADPADPATVAEVDARLEVHLDGIRVAGEAAWTRIVNLYEGSPDNGELFLLAWTAIELGDVARVARAVAAARASEDDARGFVGALAWHRPERIASLVREWVSSRDEFQRFLGVSACAEHAVDLKDALEDRLHEASPRLRAVSLRLAGLLRRADLAPAVGTALDDADERVRFWAAWALARLGNGRLAAPQLRETALGGGSEALAALRLAVTASPADEVRSWIAGMLKTPASLAVAVRGAGMLGDRTILSWLIGQMEKPAAAVAAGAALVELFTEGRDADDLFTRDPSLAGETFENHFGDVAAEIPLAARVKAWGRSRGLLG
jgi:uncharacterized protein (TIGR02270 family)